MEVKQGQRGRCKGLVCVGTFGVMEFDTKIYLMVLEMIHLVLLTEDKWCVLSVTVKSSPHPCAWCTW